MKNKRIHDILERLSRELQRAENVDTDARQKIRELHDHVDRLDDNASNPDWLWDHAKELESRFAARHPTLERIARELADAFSKMGI